MLIVTQYAAPLLRYSCYTGAVWLAVLFLKAFKKALFDPLNKIPGPALNRWSGLPLFVAWMQHRQVHYVHALHEKYGSCVRTAPNQVAFSDPTAVKSIHKMGSGFLKSQLYAKLQLTGTLLCIIPSKDHAARRKHFSSAFTQRNLIEWDQVILKKVGYMIANMKTASPRESVDILTFFTHMATDIIGELCLGESFKSYTDEEKGPSAFDPTRAAVLKDIQSELIVPGSDFMRKLPIHLRFLPPLLIRWIVKASAQSKNTEPSLPRTNLIGSTENHKHTLLTKALAENEEGVGLSDEIIVKEAKAFIVAGTDTTAVTATYLIWATLKHPGVKIRLMEELNSLPAEFSVSDVQNLEYLKMLVTETLRLYGAVSGGLPRVVPSGGREIAGYFMEEGTIVTTQSYTLHRDPRIFEYPSRFDPNRWISPTAEMKEAFMPFGIGSRVCIGMNLALMEVALTAALFFREFPHAVIAPSTTEEEMVVEDVFVMTPRGHKCMIVLN